MAEWVLPKEGLCCASLFSPCKLGAVGMYFAGLLMMCRRDRWKASQGSLWPFFLKWNHVVPSYSIHADLEILEYRHWPSSDM
jgi:hypothetical protein